MQSGGKEKRKLFLGDERSWLYRETNMQSGGKEKAELINEAKRNARYLFCLKRKFVLLLKLLSISIPLYFCTLLSLPSPSSTPSLISPTR